MLAVAKALAKPGLDLVWRGESQHLVEALWLVSPTEPDAQARLVLRPEDFRPLASELVDERLPGLARGKPGVDTAHATRQGGVRKVLAQPTIDLARVEALIDVGRQFLVEALLRTYGVEILHR